MIKTKQDYQKIYNQSIQNPEQFLGRHSQNIYLAQKMGYRVGLGI